MKWVTRDQMRTIDRQAIEDYGIPALLLMENAGRGAADHASALYREKGLRGPVWVFCGAGNNGGDGFVVARHLANAGFGVEIRCCMDRGGIDRGREAGINLTICECMGLPVGDLYTPQLVEAFDPGALDGALVVDAIFGVGLSSPVREPQAELLRKLDAARPTTLAVDIPSGLDADSGQPLGVALHADLTATMACPKVGLRGAGESYAGRVVVVDIGAPRALVAS
ncbi:MAG: NAD(P)H-hydrate epimerase [bacterium]